MGGVSYNWIGTDGFEVKSETERYNAVYPRCHQNLTFGHCRYCKYPPVVPPYVESLCSRI